MTCSQSSALSHYYPIISKAYVVGLPWLLKKVFNLGLMAADEGLRKITEFVDGQELLTKLGPSCTMVKYGGTAIGQPIEPDNLKECIDFDLCAKNNSISDSDVKKARAYYAKLDLHVD